jgi:hypothetical protein
VLEFGVPSIIITVLVFGRLKRLLNYLNLAFAF